MLATLITHLIALTVGGAAGFYLHYKFGGTLAADVAKIRTMVP